MNARATVSQRQRVDLDLRDSLAAVESRLREVTNSEVPVLREASAHLLDAGGKRLRPRLTLLSLLAAGGDNLTAAVEVAAAVELVHSASVVHDDINDHGLLRRGRPSINAVWGRTFALLTGDFLFTKVYELMAPWGELNVLLSKATVALVEGETLQASAVASNSLNRDTYLRIISLKTAALFRAAAAMGAHLATDAHLAPSFGEYGYHVGMAFQIIDDILDLTSNDETLGKTVGRDRQQGKGYAAAYNGNDLDIFKRKLLENEGAAIVTGRAYAAKMIEHAEAAIRPLPESPAKESLLQLARFILERES